jgi:hypothetical protein
MRKDRGWIGRRSVIIAKCRLGLTCRVRKSRLHLHVPISEWVTEQSEPFATSSDWLTASENILQSHICIL